MGKVVLSGMRPTGKLHIGHIEGVLREWVELQKDHQCNFFVADYHAITTDTNTKALKEDTIDMVRDWIATGVDPEISNVFIQSYVPEHAQLHLILSMLVNLGRLERLPTFNAYMKEILKVDEGDVKKYDEVKRASVNYGFLGYPILQAADILLYNTTTVPVGEDQVPHIELTREIAKRFNSLYGDVLIIPEAKLGHSPRILGTDGRKMSKSYDNVIAPTDNLEDLQIKVRKMISDPGRPFRKDPGNPYVCSVFDLQEVFDGNGSKNIVDQCRSAELGCGDCKYSLARKIVDTYAEFNEKRELMTDDYICDVLRDGSKKARVIASQTLDKVRDFMLMKYI
jgi:tryptophanyl-tRNA synthetase